MSSAALSLHFAEPDSTGARLAELEAQVATRERELTALKVELQALQSRYLSEIGVLYAELNTVEAAVAEEEIRLGLRPPPLLEDDEDDDTAEGAPGTMGATAGCSNRPAASGNLKRIFRDVARAIHPDRARDDRARFRRHSLMAEANRAYAEQDEDRLRLIMRAWEDSAESGLADLAEPEDARARRRLARLGDRLVEIDAELADLRASAIARLQRRIEETAAQGWDLFAEMLGEVRRGISRASARLAKLRRVSHAKSPASHHSI